MQARLTRPAALLASLALAVGGLACGGDDGDDEAPRRSADRDALRRHESPHAVQRALERAARSGSCARLEPLAHPDIRPVHPGACRDLRRLARSGADSSIQDYWPYAAAIRYFPSQRDASRDREVVLLRTPSDGRLRLAEVATHYAGPSRNPDASTDRFVRRAVRELREGRCRVFAASMVELPSETHTRREVCATPAIRRFEAALREARRVEVERLGTTGFIAFYTVATDGGDFALLLFLGDKGYRIWAPYRIG